MKIAFFHELPFGGAHRVVVEYGKILSKNHDVDVFYVDREEEKNLESIFNKSYFFRFSQKSGRGWWGTRLYNDTLGLFFLSILHWRIARLIDEQKYDFVFVHPSKFTQAPFVLRFLKSPIIYFCQEPLRLAYDPFISRLPDVSLPKMLYEKSVRFMRKVIDRSNVGFCDFILVNSSFSKKTIQQAYGKDATVCYLGVDENNFKQIPSKNEYDVLFVGQKIAVEGYDLLEEALSYFPKKIKVKVIERNLQGEGIADRQLAEEINSAKIVVALSRNEPFGLTVLEAMACGAPVVAVKEGGYIETVIDGETGFLIDRNPNELYEKISILLADGKLRERFGEYGKHHVLQNWTWEKSVERFLKIISQGGEK